MIFNRLLIHRQTGRRAQRQPPLPTEESNRSHKHCDIQLVTWNLPDHLEGSSRTDDPQAEQEHQFPQNYRSISLFNHVAKT